MKQHVFITYLGLMLFAFSGCKEFLDLPPKNQRTVTTLNDLKSLLGAQLRGVVTLNIKPLYGNIAPACPSPAFMMFEAYSDNINFEEALHTTYLVPDNRYISSEEGYADLLLWNQQATSSLLWTHHYSIVGFMNSLIDQSGTIAMTAGERDQMLGEMYANRAFSLFKLLQYYGIYNDAVMGIPVYLHTGEGVLGVKMPRKTHVEVYAILLNDLKKSLEMVNRTSPLSGFNALYNKRFINHLLAQVYWYKAESPAREASDYESVRQHSLAALESVDTYIPRTAVERYNAYAGKVSAYPVITQQSNVQAAISGIYGAEFQYLGGRNPTNIPLTEEFASLFTGSDIRIESYFNVNPARADGRVGTEGRVLNWAWPADGTSNGTNKRGQVCMFKPEEAYMMLAEAQHRLGADGEALVTLNKFRSFRNATAFTNLSGPALLSEIINERRREFFGDSDKRWLDKRYANKTIRRKLTFFGKEYDIIVPPHDYRYALPIPLNEIQENRLIVPNPGWGQLEY